MRIKKLKIEDFRNLESVKIEPHERLNYLYGSNGAGKSSVLESIVVLSRGRSFRTQQSSELIRTGSQGFRIVAEACSESGKTSRLGLERDKKGWRARKNSEDVRQLSLLARELPLVLMEPNSHQLVSGAPDGRRRFIDWGVFHVEPAYLQISRRFARTLKQRNAALRNGQEGVLESLDAMLNEYGEILSEKRSSYAQRLSSAFQIVMSTLSPEMPRLNLQYRAGWVGPLSECLVANRQQDLARGATTSGPHRADLVLKINGAPAKSILSRGEQKLVCAALILTQGKLLAQNGDRPLVLLDDLVSEFDASRFGNVLDHFLQLGGQLWLTGTGKKRPATEHKLFHVEHGAMREML